MEDGSIRYRRDERILNTLSRIAADISSPVKNYRLASGIVIKNNIVSFGINSYKTDPFQARWAKNKHAIHLHAEVNAIKNAIKRIGLDDLRKSTLYVARVVVDNRKDLYERAMSMPCIGCQRCIAEFQIKNVVYTIPSGHEYL